MYKAAQAIDGFFSGFGYPAYEVGSVPEGTELPYITYSLNVPEWNQKATMYAQVWNRTKSNAEIIRIADEITEAIGEGLTIDIDGGHIVIWPETPLIQILTDGDYRYAYISLSINAYHIPGV